MSTRPGQPAFECRLVTKSGVLVAVTSSDFLATVQRGIALKQQWQAVLPGRTLRIHLLYPNGLRVPRADINAALAAIKGKR